MLVCQCNIISDRDIEAVIRELLDEDAWAIIVPAKVYAALMKRCKCAGCVPNVVDIITKVTENYHLEKAGQAAADQRITARRSPVKLKRGGRRHEGRSSGYRTA
jgi:bacterioferritin-associated ferredoxin